MSTGARKYVPKGSTGGDALTVPSPSGGGATIQVPGDGDAPVASARPTRVPDYDVDALAAQSSWETHLPRGANAHLPLDLSVPIRRRTSAEGASLRAAFLLSHVDDRLTIGEIASSAQIPIDDAISCFVLLAELGIVELRGSAGPNTPPPSPVEKTQPLVPKSGLRSRR